MPVSSANMSKGGDPANGLCSFRSYFAVSKNTVYIKLAFPLLVPGLKSRSLLKGRNSFIRERGNPRQTLDFRRTLNC